MPPRAHLAIGERLLVVEMGQEGVTTGLSRGKRPELLLNIKTSLSALDSPSTKNDLVSNG